MGKNKLKKRTKKQQKYYKHLARQHRKRCDSNVDRRIVVLIEEQNAQPDVNESIVINNDKDDGDDRISLHASDSDFH